MNNNLTHVNIIYNHSWKSMSILTVERLTKNRKHWNSKLERWLLFLFTPCCPRPCNCY